MKRVIYSTVYFLTICVYVELYEFSTKNLPRYLPDELDCPSYNDKTMDNIQRPWGEPDRAYKTLPTGLMIKNSTIPNAGLGVFTFTFIPKYTWLGEYEGEVVDASHISQYAWQSNRAGEADYYIDGGLLETSSWQRFVNCPNFQSHENVQIHECRGRVYYMSLRDIYPGQELFVFYGPQYLRYLGIDARRYRDDLPSIFHE